MKVKCSCGIEDRGRYHKLLKRNWVVIHIDKGVRIDKCKNCVPLLWDRRKYFKEFETDINEEIERKVNKIRILKKL